MFFWAFWKLQEITSMLFNFFKHAKIKSMFFEHFKLLRLQKIGSMILWNFNTNFVKIHELWASMDTWISWKMMFFGSLLWSCKHKIQKYFFMISIHEYPPYWKFQLAYFLLSIHATSILCGSYPLCFSFLFVSFLFYLTFFFIFLFQFF